MFYKYNTVTGEYIEQSQDALYTLDGKLINGYTRTEPPEIPEGKKLFYKNNEWVLEDIPVDYRGTWENIDGDTQSITELGVTPKTGYAKEKNGKWYFIDETLAEDITLKKLKGRKLNDVKNKFTEEQGKRIFTSSLGFKVNNRRSGGSFDKDNVQSLIDLETSPINFRDADNQFRLLTTEQLETIKTEMIQDGLGLYQKKWNFENSINTATTIDDLNAIVISFEVS